MEEREETRKIQFTGKSSYIVSLPKQWIMDLGLKQGDQIRMVRKGSSTLELFPPKFESRNQKKEEAVLLALPVSLFIAQWQERVFKIRGTLVILLLLVLTNVALSPWMTLLKTHLSL